MVGVHDEILGPAVQYTLAVWQSYMLIAESSDGAYARFMPLKLKRICLIKKSIKTSDYVID